MCPCRCSPRPRIGGTTSLRRSVAVVKTLRDAGVAASWSQNPTETTARRCGRRLPMPPCRPDSSHTSTSILLGGQESDPDLTFLA
jgi:hypothetical protein